MTPPEYVVDLVFDPNDKGRIDVLRVVEQQVERRAEGAHDGLVSVGRRRRYRCGRRQWLGRLESDRIFSLTDGVADYSSKYQEPRRGREHWVVRVPNIENHPSDDHRKPTGELVGHHD